MNRMEHVLHKMHVDTLCCAVGILFRRFVLKLRPTSHTLHPNVHNWLGVQDESSIFSSHSNRNALGGTLMYLKKKWVKIGAKGGGGEKEKLFFSPLSGWNVHVCLSSFVFGIFTAANFDYVFLFCFLLMGLGDVLQ